MTASNRREFLKQSTGVVLALGSLPYSGRAAFAAPIPDNNLRSHLNGREKSIAGIPLRHKQQLKKIYAARRYVPLWSKSGQLTSTCEAVIDELKNCPSLGLHPAHYYTQVLSSWLEMQNQSTISQLEMVLSDSLYEYFDNLANGQLDQRPGDNGWVQKRSRTDVAHHALKFFSGDASFHETIDQLQPHNTRYTTLLTALKQHQLVANRGGFTRVASGPTLKPGHQGLRVAQVHQRLIESGDVDINHATTSDTYNWEITEGVKSFQQRHGLDDDGILGNKTLEELNVPIEHRIAQLEVNLDRWRWLAKDLGGNNIIVNVPGYELNLTLNYHHAFNMPVVVGKPENQTPIFSDEMEHLVFNPAWHVPVSITRDELLPKELSSTGFLDRNNFVAVSLSDRRTRPISTLSEHDLEPGRFISKYRLRQLAGKSNALGALKFMFPNQYSIYLHDTNAKHLFSRTTRAFSHGCVRVEDPQKLARTILMHDGMDNQRLDSAINAKDTKTVKLQNALPVHITYQTSWVDLYGRVQFRKDIYDHDKRAIRNYQDARPQQAHKEKQLLARLGWSATTAANEG